MQVSVETTSGLGRRMKVQIPAEQIDQQVQSKLQQLARSVRLDGFRPGKVPLSVVKKRYESQVRSETAGELIASSYEQALQQENLRPAGEPDIEQTRNQPGQELEYVATFEVYPDVEPPALTEISIQRPVAEVSSERGKVTRISTHCPGGMLRAVNVGDTRSSPSDVVPATESGCPHTLTSSAWAPGGMNTLARRRSSRTVHSSPQTFQLRSTMSS